MSRELPKCSTSPAPGARGVLRKGMIVGGRYRIESLIGCGGMAEVYRAEHRGLGKSVALKLLPSQRAAGTNLGKRFENEARIAARLDHPGCVRVLDSGTCAAGAFLVMDLVEGPTLRAVARLAAPVELERVVRIIGDVLSALDCAHELGVLHRDIKPENVMFERPDGSGRAVLIDFGLARAFEEPGLTGAGTCVGSPSYVAPERLLSDPYDERADLYSVGVMMYELLTARRPFVGATRAALMAAHVEDTPVSPDRVQCQIPGPIAEVCMRAIARDPRERFASAEAMKQALDQAWHAARPVAALVRGRATTIPGIGVGESVLDEESTPLFLDLTEGEPNRLRRLWTWLRFGEWRWPQDDAAATVAD